MLCYVMLSYVILSYLILSYVMLSYLNSHNLYVSVFLTDVVVPKNTECYWDVNLIHWTRSKVADGGSGSSARM